MAKITIYNEDCLITLRKFIEKDIKINVILTSPPYNTSKKNCDEAHKRYDSYVDFKSEDEYVKWSICLFKSMYKVLSNKGVILYNMSYATDVNPNLIWKTIGGIINNTKFMIADCIVWKKSCSMPNHSNKNKCNRICEFVFVFCKSKHFKDFHANKKFLGFTKNKMPNYSSEKFSNFIEAPNNDGQTYFLNKATYSTKLCLKLLEMYAKKDAIVYDPFMGTGTTAKACELYGDENMICYGSELSSEQIKYSKERISKYKKLF